jgi:hypothetical protein
VSFLVSKDEQQLGPYTVEEINVQLEGGMLDPADLCWTEGFEDWYPLHQIEGFVVPGTEVVPTTEAAPATAVAAEAAPGDSTVGLVSAGEVTSGGRKKWFIGGGIAAVLAATGAFLVFGGAGLDGLCQELAEPHPEPALPQDLEAKMLRVRAKVERLVADGNETEAKDRLDQLLKAAP